MFNQGDRVFIYQLSSATRYNGECAIVRSVSADANRIAVRLSGGAFHGRELNVPSVCLLPIETGMPTLLAHLAVAWAYPVVGDAIQQICKADVEAASTWCDLELEVGKMLPPRESLIVFGSARGRAGCTGCLAYAYSGKRQRWIEITRMPSKCEGATAVQISSHAVIFTGGDECKAAVRYDSLARKWDQISSPQISRRGCVGIRAGEAVYLVGGADCVIQEINKRPDELDGYPRGLRQACCIERLHLPSLTWSFVPPKADESLGAFCERQQIARIEWPSPGVMTATDGTLRLVLAGGALCGKAEAVVNTYELLVSGETVDIRPEKYCMQVPRSCAASCMWHEQLIVAGGWGGRPRQPLLSVEAFDGSSWRAMPSLNVARVGGALAVVNDRLFAVGGNSESRNVERFNERELKWEVVKSMELPCAVDGCFAYGLVWHDQSESDRPTRHACKLGSSRKVISAAQGYSVPEQKSSMHTLAPDAPTPAPLNHEVKQTGQDSEAGVVEESCSPVDAFAIGDVVEAHSLKGASYLNGQSGVVLAVQGNERLQVMFGPPHGGRALKLANLRHARSA